MDTIRTDNLRVALNDMRALHRAGTGWTPPAKIDLDDGTTLTIVPFVATEKTVGHMAGEVLEGHWTVTGVDASGHKLRGTYYIP